MREARRVLEIDGPVRERGVSGLVLRGELDMALLGDRLGVLREPPLGGG